MSQTIIESSLRTALISLPENAPEAVVSANFFDPHLLEALGFTQGEACPQFDTGQGAVDYASRKTVDNDIFLHTRSNPEIIFELKGRDINLTENSTKYYQTVNQLKKYLLAPHCKTVKWGIITNSEHIQLFRKHGKIIHPATPCLLMEADTVNDTVASIKRKVAKPIRALTVAIYNNKGGVGKTTTTVNLAAILTLAGKKVLVVDFDPNQQDLTSSLGISLSEGDVYNALTDRNIPLQNAVKQFSLTLKSGKELSFDIIPADKTLVEEIDEADLRKAWKNHTLYNKLDALRHEYDYILIDSPPNWRLFSQQAVYAADVVFIPTKHNNLFSIENAVTVITRFVTEVQAKKEDGSPIALPIFFNGEKITQPQLIAAQQEIDNLIKANKREGFDLLPYFYPRFTNARKDRHIHQIPSYASISSSIFSRIPAVYKDKIAREYYINLAKEYFLQ